MRTPFFSRFLFITSRFTHNIFLFLFFLIFFQISSFSRVSGKCLNDQRSLLQQLKDTLTYNSSLSTKFMQWNQDIDCCNWNGVECDNFGHVTGLELEEETISGVIENSSALYSLRYLENLNLAYNNFNYLQIPKELGNMTNLARLNLSSAGFGGQIPAELSQMTSLVMLDLSGYLNRLGCSNLKIFVQNFTRLEELYLDFVDFTHKRDLWEVLSLALPTLRSLSLRNCHLSGHLNSSFLQLRNLLVLRLDGNDLSDTALDFFANFGNLTVLSLSDCSLHGVFPEMIFQVSTLQHLDLSNNYKLTGTIPEFPPGGSMRTLILAGTNFSGSLTDSIINLSNLSMIDISYCNFTGPIPSTIGNLTKLVSLNLASNTFTGFISPTHYEGLSNLQELYLCYNSLTGDIPTSLFDLPSLQRLSLSHNKFSGQVNEFSILNSSLDNLDLSSNQLEGLIPKSFFRLEKLRYLTLSFNSFNGTIRLKDFQNLPNLESLELGNNLLSVNIDNTDSEFFSFLQLGMLDLASCNLSRFPNLRNQTKIYELDLSNNNISGDVPSWIWEFESLESLNLSHNFLTSLQTPYLIPYSLDYLDLHSNILRGELPEGAFWWVDYSNNNFQGHIPINIGRSISDAYFFSVANNSLTGEIPISLCNATIIGVIDMSDNSLSGVLPPCLVQNLTNLGVLNIGGNNISGNIPDTFSASCSLSTLDLSGNKFQGIIPPSLANCKSLQVMNVASNNISDTFPCMLLNSSNLHVLVLRSNKFFGDIRCHGFGHNCSNLQIIDIAFNEFTGFLDRELLSSLTEMKHKNSPRLAGDPLGFEYGNNNNYQATVTVTLKGLEFKIVKILTILTSIDFSSNKFRGFIPEIFGELSSLYALNLSHNSFTGAIPKSLSNLINLESLSLSANQLTGNIPTEFVSLVFLSFFDVSYNELVGRIPSGLQFETFSASSYEGNIGLCGSPINQSCDSYTPGEASVTSKCEKDVDWVFMLAGLGYAVGVVLVVVPPLFSRRCAERLEALQVKLLKLICRNIKVDAT